MENAGIYDQRDDETLLKLYVEHGDRQAMGVLFNRHADVAYATALRMCRNAADSEDAVQSAFIYVMKNATRFKGGSMGGVKAWLMKSVLGACKTSIRGEIRRRRRQELAADEQDESYVDEVAHGPDDELSQRAEEVMQALDSLPPQYRKAVWVHCYHGLSYKDAAEMLEIPEKKFGNQLQNGLHKLRANLADRGVHASVAAIAAFLPDLPVGPAPASVLNAISGIVSGTIKGAAGAAAGVGAGGLLMKIAAAAVVAGGVVAIVTVNRETKEDSVPAPTPPPQNVARDIHYSWDFNTPGVPPQFKARLGKVVYVPGGGPNKDGCLQIEGETHEKTFNKGDLLAEVMIDVPIGSFPISVSYRCRSVNLEEGRMWDIRVAWFPFEDVVLFRNITPVFNLKSA